MADKRKPLTDLPYLKDSVLKIIAREKAETNDGKCAARVDIQALPLRFYLENTLIPILRTALGVVATERPPDPIEYLAVYLLLNKEHYEVYPNYSTCL